ncbi:helix-turn-helix transcriptional regulator [Ensifer adhaerens]|uniref:helix-turn-helix domain-containing protein n=1 Tax=Ensifer adhaerens TaxID=106592 RepID=UPI0023A9E779|nr:helix-turn-helix transcriptional regulator [Ensifer adhaerens]WDZ78195.1 helix-turn-helix transcriptional regulator [Ensifer adhaerens]
MSDSGPVTIAVRIDDPALAERLSELLTSVDWVRLAPEGEEFELVLSTARAATEGVGLSSREREVVALLADGLSNKEIARKLGISVDTAKFHVGRVIDKLDATGRTDAVAHAARRGVIHL